MEFVFEQAFYSVPFHLIGQQVRVRGGKHEVRIYIQDCELVATHRHVWGERATRCNDRMDEPSIAGLYWEHWQAQTPEHTLSERDRLG